jgi:hypothetical protein
MTAPKFDGNLTKIAYISTVLYKAISTSSLARYEYTSGDILYLSIPANTINDLDFFLSDVNVWKENTVRLYKNNATL